MSEKQYPSHYMPYEPIARPNPPTAATVPPSNWYIQPVSFQWTLDSTEDGTGLYPPGYNFQYTWTSTTFDLRPQLLSGNAGPKDATPMWSPACRLYVGLSQGRAISGIQPFVNTDNLRVRAVDWLNTTFDFTSQTGAPSDQTNRGAGGGLYRGALLNASHNFNNPRLRTLVLAGFAPPGTALGSGEGYPVRFWRLQLVFTQFVETGLPLPVPALNSAIPLVLQASMY